MLTYSADSGEILFKYNGLISALKSLSSYKVYTMTSDENVIVDLGTMNGNTLTINGNFYNINGNNYNGISISNGQEIYLNEIGKISQSGSVLASFNGFNVALNIDQNAKATVENSVFDNNSIDINNNGSLFLKGNNTFNDDITSSSSTGSLSIENGLSNFNSSVSQQIINVAENASAVFNAQVNSNIENFGFVSNKNDFYGNFNNAASTSESFNNGAIYGNITNLGSFFNQNGSILGDIDSSGSFSNLNGNISGNINNTGSFDNNNGFILGDIDSSGSFSNLNGNISGNVNNTGSFDNKYGHISGNVTNNANPNVENSGIFNTNLSNVSGSIENNSIINIDGGILQNNLSGSGSANINGTVTNIDYSFSQDNINISENKSFYNLKTLTVNNTLINNGTIKGTGDLIISSGASVNNISGTISQNTVSIGENASLTTNADNFKATNGIENSGSITFLGGKINSNITNSSAQNGVVNFGENNSAEIPPLIYLNSDISNNTINLNNATLAFGNNASIANNSAFNTYSGKINLADGTISQVNLGNNVTINGKTDLALDFDLSSLKTDSFIANITGGNGKFNVSEINVIGNTSLENIKINLSEATNLGQEFISAENKDLPVIVAPIRKLAGKIEDGWIIYSATGSSCNDLNPSVLAAPVTSQAGATATLHQTFNYAFRHADNFMNLPYIERIAAKNADKFAILPAGGTTFGNYSPLFSPSKEASFWVKPYANFENVPLKNGPKVSNIAYGTLIGVDSPLTSLKHGWERVWTGYLGYNGVNQRYYGMNLTQNGGLIGGTLTLYKGNFFNATTFSVGADVSDNTNMYGHENVVMLLGGLGNKFGYNLEINDGKVILQPSLFLNYSFVNTFDYNNAAGVRIKAEPLHSIQIAPGIKLIANTKGGWQPYIGISMAWNILDKSNVSANGVRLPEMSIKPYVQYGVGIQRKFQEKYTAFGQAMVQSGGRNGVAITLGFKWMLGKDDKSPEKVLLDKQEITKLPTSIKISSYKN